MARIALLDQYAGLGGGQQVLMDLARFFRSCGDAVSVHLPGEGSTSRTLASEGFAVHPLPLPAMTPGKKSMGEKVAYPAHAWRASRSLVLQLRGAGPCLLYANGPRTFLPAVLAARSLGAPVFCALHLFFPGGPERRLIRWCFSRSQVRGILFCSDTVAAPFEEFVGVKAFVAPYWVSPRFLGAPFAPGAFRERLGVPRRAVLAGVVGRISPTKGQRFFLRAVAPLLRSHPDLHFAVVGSADFESRGEEEALRAEREASPDPGRIHLALEMTDALEFMDSLDILVVPSLWEEPFGLVAVEGMARRLPVVATRSGGLAETVRDGETGYVVAKEADALREAVSRLASDPALRRSFGDAGRRLAEERHDPRTCMAALRARALGAAGLPVESHG